MQLYIIRHAQSENNASWARTGTSDGRTSDPDLTEIGIEQAKGVARFLAQSEPEKQAGYGDIYNRGGFNLTHLYSSYMLRSVRTGTYIAQATGLPLIAWEAIHEWGGMYEKVMETEEIIVLPGSNRAFFKEHFPDFEPEEALGEAGWWNFRPYETAAGTFLRAARFLNELLDRHTEDDRVGIVTHGGFSDSMLKVLLNHWPIYGTVDEELKGVQLPSALQTNAPEQVWFRLNNASVSRIDFFPERFVVVYWNRIDFLPGELIT